MEVFIQAMVDGLIDLGTKASIACAGIVGVAITIFGLKWVVSTIKEFFYGIAISHDDGYYSRDNSDPDGWTAEDEYEYYRTDI